MIPTTRRERTVLVRDERLVLSGSSVPVFEARPCGYERGLPKGISNGRWASCLLVGAIAVAGASTHVPARADEPPGLLSSDEERWRALFRAGYDDIRTHRWEEARRKLTDAFAIRSSYDVALALGQAEYNLERYSDAAQHLDYYLKNVPAREKMTAIEDAKNIQDICMQHVARLRITVDQGGAEVSVDGRPLGKSPLAMDGFVEPGSHTVEARKGELGAKEMITVEAGKEYPVVLRVAGGAHGSILRREIGAPSSSPASAPAASSAGSVPFNTPDGGASRSEPGDESKSWVPVYVGAGLALVGLGVGFGWRLAADSDRDRAQALKDKNGPSGCSSGTAAIEDCESARDAVRRFDSKRDFSSGAFVFSGIAAVATIAYLVWPRSAQAEQRGVTSYLRVRPAVSMGGAGLLVSTRF